MAESERYAIAVIGGATAGAEAAGIFAQRGILTVVFEQNARPYGKVEDERVRTLLDDMWLAVKRARATGARPCRCACCDVLRDPGLYQLPHQGGR